MPTPRITARQWAIENGFPAVAQTISDIEKEWHERGKHTRRNWWEVLAGNKRGNPRVIAGREFPVIAEIRARQKLKPTQSAVSTGCGKRVPKPLAQGRWGGQLKSHL